jgi:CRISPR-associated protein (TIGR03984 family)
MISQDLCQEISTQGIKDSLENWLKQQAITKDYHLPYLLAHALDGVIWGFFEADSCILSTSTQAFPECDFASLNLSSLQQCRVFGSAGEILLWNVDGEWRARLILETNVSKLVTDKEIGVIQEKQILWGTQGRLSECGKFTLLADGSQGLKHAVPIAVSKTAFKKDANKLYRPIRLELHHYYNYDKDGVARIFLSRLVNIESNNK